MKTRLVAVLLLAVFGVLACTACSGSDESADRQVSASTDYSSWNAEDWNAASDAEQNDCAYYVFTQVGDVMYDGFSAMMKDAGTSQEAQDKIDSATEQLRELIGPYLESDSANTVGGLIESARDAVDVLSQQ